MPRDQFLVGGEAWRRFRAGEADPAKFGLSQLPEAGDWWIAANLMRDGAALLNIELLPWDCWGAMPTPADPIGEDLAALFDRLAELTLAPDDNLAELRRAVLRRAAAGPGDGPQRRSRRRSPCRPRGRRRSRPA